MEKCLNASTEINIALVGVTLLFFSFLSILYFMKKKVDNLEIKIYKFLLLWVLLELSTFLIQSIFDLYGNRNFEIIKFLIKIRMTAQSYWYFFINLYRIVVIKEQDKDFEVKFKHKKKTVYGVIIAIMFIIGSLGFLLPMHIEILEDNATHVRNSAVMVFWALYLVINIFLYIGILIYSRGKFDKKKFAPFFIIDIFMLSIFFLGRLWGDFAISIVMRALVIYVMYHTLENPDIKLVNQLTLAKNQAEKSNNAKSDFLSSMSHELRTPLNAIVGLSQLIESDSDQQEIRSDAKDIVVASENLLELVNGILDINKLEANELERNEENYEVRNILKELESMIQVRIGDKPIELRTNFSSNLPTVLYGDKTNLKRIISNLLTNAVKYTNEGYIDFIVECTNSKDKCNLKITVKDTGRGISEDRIPLLFTKFNRLESDKDSDIGGTGLGLAITKSLVDLLEGKITVESKLGEGSTFTVNLTQVIIEESKVELEIL